jgi:fatty acid desaturase
MLKTLGGALFILVGILVAGTVIAWTSQLVGRWTGVPPQLIVISSVGALLAFSIVMAANGAAEAWQWRLDALEASVHRDDESGVDGEDDEDDEDDDVQEPQSPTREGRSESRPRIR